MKYTVYDGSRYIKVGEADSDLEALKMRDQFMDSNPSNDCVIEDSEGNYLDFGCELCSFVAEIMDHTSEDLEPLTPKEALRTMMEWYRNGVDIPYDMTAEILSYYWNDLLESKADREAAKIEARDDQIAATNPNCIRFRKAYQDGSSAFFDPEQLTHDLIRTGYDEVHLELIAKALMAYHKNYQESI